MTAPRERPILFSAPMVRAIPDGRKTQTRRLYKPRQCDAVDAPGGPLCALPCPYGSPGDRLWVRETWRTAKCFDSKSPRNIAEMAAEAGYEHCWAPVAFSDGSDSGGIRDFGGEFGKTRSSLFMPRWASRITLEITEVRVQRLQEISDDDARDEGVATRCLHEPDEAQECSVGWRNVDGFARDNFRELWDSVNGKRAPWSSNPLVRAITFRRIS